MTTVAPLSMDQLLAAAQEEGQFAGLYVDRMAELARKDPAFFLSYVMRDEETGKMIVLAPTHEAWQDLITTHDRAVILGHVESGKTASISIGRTLWEIGNKPSLRVCILSNTHGQAAKIVRAISQHIENSESYRKVFPNVKPGDPWTERSITLQRPHISKDPTVQATGVHGNIHGARIDLLIVDDILDYENTRTEKGREETWNWLQATVFGRLTEKSRVVVVGNAFHPEDALHKLAKLPGWQAVRYPVLDDQGKPRWPERWSLERIEKRRLELSPLEFSRQMMCVPYDDSEARFKREWIEVCKGRGCEKLMDFRGLNVVPRGYKTITGVDLAVQQHASADFTCLFTIIVHPDGTREVLNIESGKWAGPEIVERIADVHRRYLSLIIVENNAAQAFIEQWLRRRGVPVRGFTTGRNKVHPEYGIESLANELAQGQWIIPSMGKPHREIQAWIDELLYYDPASHTGDRLMASWFAREGVRMSELQAGPMRLDIVSR